MKRSYFLLLLAALFIFSCSDNPTESIPQETKVDMSDFYLFTDDDLSHKSNDKHSGDKCYSMKVLNKQLTDNPSLYNKMYAVEKHTRQFIAAKKGGNGNGGGRPGGGDGGDGGDGGGSDDDGLGVINIPVYVHIVYPNAFAISDGQVNSQINVLNQDFGKTNSDIGQVPSEFTSFAADSQISFSLADIFRYNDNRDSWGTSNAVKTTYPPVTPATHLNIWVCNIGGGILGYAQFPGGNLATDGIVVGPEFFGTEGMATAPFNLGRTATHEVGHYLNLRHIWGDGRCNRDDFVDDTPRSDRPNYSCPNYPTVHCRSTDMTMNYMDYTDDRCMYMFTNGQKERMRALFAPGGARTSMIPSI